MRLTVIAPIHDELDNLDPLVERVAATLDDLGLEWELILVDDGSRDGSSRRIDELAADRPRIRPLHLDGNHGQSAALATGIAHARGELVALIDADLQTYPEDLPTLLAKLEDSGADLVSGIRVERRDPWFKRFSSGLANAVRDRITGDRVEDTGCPLKLLRTPIARRLGSWKGMHRFIPTLVRIEGGTVVQVPVRHAPRTAGRSKYGTLDRALRGLVDAFGIRWLRSRRVQARLRKPQ